jgi:hypothetical protein
LNEHRPGGATLRDGGVYYHALSFARWRRFRRLDKRPIHTPTCHGISEMLSGIHQRMAQSDRVRHAALTLTTCRCGGVGRSEQRYLQSLTEIERLNKAPVSFARGEDNSTSVGRPGWVNIVEILRLPDREQFGTIRRHHIDTEMALVDFC